MLQLPLTKKMKCHCSTKVRIRWNSVLQSIACIAVQTPHMYQVELQNILQITNHNFIHTLVTLCNTSAMAVLQHTHKWLHHTKWHMVKWVGAWSDYRDWREPLCFTSQSTGRGVGATWAIIPTRSRPEWTIWNTSSTSSSCQREGKFPIPTLHH